MSDQSLSVGLEMSVIPSFHYLETRWAIPPTAPPTAPTHCPSRGAFPELPRAGVRDITQGFLRTDMVVLGDPEPENCVRRPGLVRLVLRWCCPLVVFGRSIVILTFQANFNPSGNLCQASRSCWIEPGCWQRGGKHHFCSARHNAAPITTG